MNRCALAVSLFLALSSPAFAAADCSDTDPGVACGPNAVAGDPSNVAIGNDARTLDLVVNGAPVAPTNTTAVGAWARAVAGGSAFGAWARALEADTTAVGRSALADGLGATAIGANAKSSGLYSVAVGRMAEVSAGSGIAMGYAARSTGGITIGAYSEANDGALALGSFSKSSGFGALAVGNQTVANQLHAVSFGHGAEATAASASALGALAKAQAAGSVALGAGSIANEFNTVSFGAAGATRRLVNLSAGVADTDGVNVSQLKALAPALGGGSTVINGVFVNPIYNLSGGTFVNVGDALTYLDNRITNVALTPGPQGPQGPTGPAGPQGPGGLDGRDGTAGAGGSPCAEAICYDDASKRTATLNKGGGATRVRNVADGVAASDAVNVSQLEAGVSRAVNTSNAYTDQRISELRGDVWRVDRNARGGIASAMAIAGLPQAYAPGARMAAVAASGYRGEAGFAVGVSGITESGRWLYKVAGSGNTTGDFGMTVGAGIQW